MNTTIFSRKNLIWTVFIVALFTLIEVLMMADIIGAYYKITLMLIGINVILAVGLNIIIGITGQFSLGHAGFMSVGAYSCAITIKMFPWSGLASKWAYRCPVCLSCSRRWWEHRSAGFACGIGFLSRRPN